MFEENQMGLFGEMPAEEKAAEAPKAPAVSKVKPEEKPKEKSRRAAAPAAPAMPARVAMAAAQRVLKKTKPQPQKVVAAPPRKVSGLVPEGDVRLTANIRQDLHLKLKITSAYRRTTIGELIEELVEKYL